MTAMQKKNEIITFSSQLFHLLLFFSHSEDCLSTLLIVSFAVQKLLSLIMSHLFLFPLLQVIEVLAVVYVSVLPMFSSRNFIVFDLAFTSLIHFEFIFVYGVRKCSNFILLHVDVLFSQHHLLERLSLLHCIFLLPLSKIRYPQVHGFISGLSCSIGLYFCFCASTILS